MRISLIIALACAFSSTFAATIEVVSKPFAHRPQSIGDSLGLHLSADGRWAAFSSSANGLLPSSGETTPEFSLNAYLKNLESSDILLLSRNPAGQRSDGVSVATGMSRDGRFVVFESDSADLVAGDTNKTSDIFLFDRASNAVTRVSTVITIGSTTNELAEAGAATLTSDGRYGFFEAQIGTNSYYFRFDAGTGATVPAITGTDGQPWPSILNPSPSDDGRFVAFRSTTNLLAPQAQTDVPQLFLHDTLLRTNYWLSRTATADGQVSATNGPAAYVSDALISRDNRVVAFVASDLSEAPGSATPPASVLHLYSIDTKSIFRIPLPDEVSPITLPRFTSFDVSADAQTVVYTLSHLPQAGATSYLPAQLYLYDQAANTNRSLTTTPGEVLDSQISDDGSRIVFTAVSDSTVAGFSQENPQLYLFERETGRVQLLSRSASGAEADEPVLNPVLSADGSVAGFETLASNLSTNDDPTGFDLFTVNLSEAGAPQLVSAPHSAIVASTASGLNRLAPAYLDYFGRATPPLSADGQRVLLVSTASDLAPEDPFPDVDLFVADLAGNPTKLLSSVTNAPLNPFFRPAPNPFFMDASADLNRVVFAENRSLYVFNRIAQSVTPATVLPDGSIGQWQPDSADLSADGRYLLFITTAISGPFAGSHLWVRDLEEQVTKLVPGADFRQSSFNQISEGGRYLLNPSSVASGSPGGTHVIDLQTGVKRTLNLVALYSAWDDSIMLFARSGRPVQSAELWTYNPVSHQTNFVATNAIHSVLSADGSVIVYSQNADDQWRSFIFETATRTATPLMVDGGDFLFAERPVVTPDGRFIAFTIDESEPGDTRVGNLYVLDRILTNLTKIAAPDGRAIEHLRRYAISANGRTIVFESADDRLVPNDRNLNTDTFAVRLAMTDTDNDSLEDGWEIRHFGKLDPPGSADVDGDGVANLLEFQAGTDPQNAASKFTVSATLSSNRVVTLEWPSALGKTYQPQTSATLAPGSWTDFGPPVTAVNYKTRTTFPANNRAFYRVEILD